MTSHHLPHDRCCGVQITFHEQCGHTLIATDHHPTCLQLSTQPPLTLPQPFPQPYPKCKDLHRYIHLQSSNCSSCNAPPKIGNWDPVSSSFSSGKKALCQEDIFERGVYWLNKLLSARDEELQGEVADWKACLREEGFRYDCGCERRVFEASELGNKGGEMKRRLPCVCLRA